MNSPQLGSSYPVDSGVVVENRVETTWFCKTWFPLYMVYRKHLRLSFETTQKLMGVIVHFGFTNRFPVVQSKGWSRYKGVGVYLKARFFRRIHFRFRAET